MLLKQLFLKKKNAEKIEKNISRYFEVLKFATYIQECLLSSVLTVKGCEIPSLIYLYNNDIVK